MLSPENSIGNLEQSTVEPELTVAEVSAEIKEEYKKRVAESKDLPEQEKKLLVIDCTLKGPDEETNTCYATRTITLGDQRINPSNTDIVLAAHGGAYPESFENTSGIIISGSAADIEGWRDKPELAWIKKTEDFVKKALENKIPVLGICFGMQLVADLKGRGVPQNTGGLEKGAWETSLYMSKETVKHPIFNGLDFQYDASGENVSSVIDTIGTHSYRVEGTGAEHNIHGYSFPERVYDFDHLDPSIVQGEKPNLSSASPMVEIDGSFVGVQFHPESATPLGVKYQKSLLRSEKTKEAIERSGQDIEQIREGLDSYEFGSRNDSRKFLSNFLDMCELKARPETI